MKQLTRKQPTLWMQRLGYVLQPTTWTDNVVDSLREGVPLEAK